MAEDDRPFRRPDAPWVHTEEVVEPEAAEQPAGPAAAEEEAPVDPAATDPPWAFTVFDYAEVRVLHERGLEIAERGVTAQARHLELAERSVSAQLRHLELAERSVIAGERLAAAAERIAVSFETALEIATSE